MKTNPNDPSFSIDLELKDYQKFQMYGLTKREYFAAMAIQGMAYELDYDEEVYAKNAVKLADALIEALNKDDE